MTTTTFQLKGEFIALCDLLKLEGVADSGGQGKSMVAEGLISVDGQIRAGQVVQAFEQTITVVAAA
ncbi:RNA-binding S4 domain-containing protein [Methylophilus sp.]|uniref:RNA-binding S4 domain-containing protein n=1 Tax=Methylophilus sp. TaxID=29541 RepID=UPI00403793F4